MPLSNFKCFFILTQRNENVSKIEREREKNTKKYNNNKYSNNVYMCVKKIHKIYEMASYNVCYIWCDLVESTSRIFNMYRYVYMLKKTLYRNTPFNHIYNRVHAFAIVCCCFFVCIFSAFSGENRLNQPHLTCAMVFLVFFFASYADHITIFSSLWFVTH